ncbi:unnamed protein product [Rangifer tarandus platyrhynchus]|uniref:Secreted protein n=2 Tax=Rangifer tarandus platyrhynchus TaxID=3082113 RepID=A0ABN8ZHQ9_RANTA|nr:unnamed protein product [Rangifer tarandus platyrhynchus]
MFTAALLTGAKVGRALSGGGGVDTAGQDSAAKKRAGLQRYSLDEPKRSVRTAGRERPRHAGVLPRPRTCRFQPVLSHQARGMDGSAVLRAGSRGCEVLQGEAAGVHSPCGSTPQLTRRCTLRIWQGQVLG